MHMNDLTSRTVMHINQSEYAKSESGLGEKWRAERRVFNENGHIFGMTNYRIGLQWVFSLFGFTTWVYKYQSQNVRLSTRARENMFKQTSSIHDIVVDKSETYYTYAMFLCTACSWCVTIICTCTRYTIGLQYDTRCYFNMRSKADMSQLNLPHGNDN